MTLSAQSIEWAVEFVSNHSDGDLFPRISEMVAILNLKAEFAAEIAGKPLTDIEPGPHRRFIVPKDEISYRQATQLDPQDSILLSAIVYEFGTGIESRRLDTTKVFSYRFSPSATHGLYAGQSSWNDFWTTAARLSRRKGCILYCDISDFYNQIYHHTVENQLIASGFPNQAVKWVISLLESTTAGVSRGVPIGPHAVHLLAEASLIPIDNSMQASGIEFIRYADDIVIFTKDESDAKRALARLANILDKQQRLTIQRHKTKFFMPKEFYVYCRKMIEDRPINNEEDNLLKVVRKYSGGNPYSTISYNQISSSDWKKISHSIIRKIITEYLESSDIDYIRLRWFYRRLAQIGHPGAIDVTLERISALTPCFASICAYFSSLQEITQQEWLQIGERLLTLFENEEVQESEYFRLSILSLFSRSPHINHFNKLSALFVGGDPFAKREIILAARTSGAVDWVRELKEGYDAMDHWQKMALLFCAHDFPPDERKYFINRCRLYRPFDRILAKWSKSGT